MINRLIPTFKSSFLLNKFYSTTADRINYYEILGVQSGATNIQINQAYNLKSKIFNPQIDPVGFHKLSEAFVILTNGKSRDAYDSLLKSRANSYFNSNQQQVQTTTKGYLASRKQQANKLVRKKLNIDQFGRYKGGLPKFRHYTNASIRGNSLEAPGQLSNRQEIEAVYDKFPEFNIVDPQIAQSFKNYQQKDRKDKSQKQHWITLQVDFDFFTFKKFRTVYWPYIRLISFFALIVPIWLKYFQSTEKLALQNQIRKKSGLPPL